MTKKRGFHRGAGRADHQNPQAYAASQSSDYGSCYGGAGGGGSVFYGYDPSPDVSGWASACGRIQNPTPHIEQHRAYSLQSLQGYSYPTYPTPYNTQYQQQSLQRYSYPTPHNAQHEQQFAGRAIRREEAVDDQEEDGRKAYCTSTKAVLNDVSSGHRIKEELPSGLCAEVAPFVSKPPYMNVESMKSKVERAAKLAYDRLLDEKKGVTLWKVVQAVLLSLEVESLEALGFSLHDDPTLRKIFLIEGKVNTYIHCHVAVKRITTVHDLSTEICQNEGVKEFDELKLGPIFFFPLVRQYFALPGDAEVCRITTEDVLNHLSDFLNKNQGKIEVEDFLSFLTKARSVPSPQHLGVRIQSLGMYVSFIRREKKAERTLASQRANMAKAKEAASRRQDEMPSIVSRIDAFLAASGTPKVTISSDEDDENVEVIPRVASNSKGSALASSEPQSNSCPYPSVAEERIRVCAKVPADLNEEFAKFDYALSKQELGDFVAAWRGICQKSSLWEVLMQMLFANESKKSLKKKRKMARLFSTYPAIGILNVAILSMKAGHWNSLYDAFEQVISTDVHESKGANAVEAAGRIEVVAGEPYQSGTTILNSRDSSIDNDGSFEAALGEILARLEDVCKDVDRIPEDDRVGASREAAFGQILERIVNCQRAFMELFPCKSMAVKDSSKFVDRYLEKLSQLFTGIWTFRLDKTPAVVLPDSMLKAFISQVAMVINDMDVMSEINVSKLLAKQFPFLSTRESCLHLMDQEQKSLKGEKATRFSFFYSHALLATNPGVSRSEAGAILAHDGSERQVVARVGVLGSVTSTDARNCLLKAPMLCNLLEWSQWDAVFAPTLGPLLEWVEREGSSWGLVGLVTSDGCVLRIDGSATVDNFLTVAVKGLGKETATQLVSLIAVYGGVERVPQALLRSYLSKAIEILVGQPVTANKNKRKTLIWHEIDQPVKRAKHHVFEDVSSSCRSGNQAPGISSQGNHLDKFSRGLQFVWELLLWMPLDFVVFAASVAIPALSGIVPGAPVAMLSCSSAEQRMRLHEIGMALGITEWVKDFRFLVVEPHCPLMEEDTSPQSKWEHVSTELSPSPSLSMLDLDVVKDPATEDKTLVECQVSSPVDGREEEQKEATADLGCDTCAWNQSRPEKEADAVIAMIRREEFGVDLDLSCQEQKLLTKQHARIGRALKCLSRELYSQDSHFVLELVQNADDNQYAPDVDAMLVFILQAKRVVVVNNEVGFNAANMRALCDVGSSTKSGSSAGYIGQKGIGFKSVFRITDSPQIHSSGFHVKFDISDGSIGFVLPTVVPPLNDWHSIQEVLSTTESLTNCGNQAWNTCMVLPLKESIVRGAEVEILSSKLRDIQPSLLLFLRRLCSITVKDDVSGTMRTMQRFDLCDGFLRVADNGDISHWLVVKEQFDAAVLDRQGVGKTEIALAFPLREVANGEFEACHDPQQVFAFLPLRSYGLRFIVQADFVLPSSREDLDTDSTWNQWLLSEIPNIFVKAIEAFKEVSCFKRNGGKSACVFLSFLPLEGEVQGFFSSLPRMIYASLRAIPCLPVDGKDGEWALPCVILGGWNESVKKLLPEHLLWQLLGLRYLHKDVVITSVLASELGIHTFGLPVLIDFMENLCARKEILEDLGPKWIRLWLATLHRCLLVDLENCSGFVQTSSKTQQLKRLKGLPFIPLSNGSYTSLEDGPVWLPGIDLDGAGETAALLEDFPLLYSELRTVHSLLLMPVIEELEPKTGDNQLPAAGSELTSSVISILRRLGVGHILGHDVVMMHILPHMMTDDVWDKPKSLLTQYLAFVVVHLQSDCKHCKTERANIMKILQENCVLVTNHGYKRVSDGPVHFAMDFGCPIDVKAIIKGFPLTWTEVDPAYLHTFQGWPDDTARSRWRSFLKELGVTDFVKLRLVKRQLHDKATSSWKDVPWKGCDGHGRVFIEDWECTEAVQLLECLCDLSANSPERLAKCAQVLSAFDRLWEECYSDSDALYWSNSSLDKQSTLPSFILQLRSFAWVQSSLDRKLYHPTELFHRCSAVELILGTDAPYATPQIQSGKFASALGLQTDMSAQAVLGVLKFWNQLPIHISVGQMTRLYTCLWNEMRGGKDMHDFFQTQAWIFVPEGTITEENTLVMGHFWFLKDVVWRDETGCLSFTLKGIHADDGSRKRPPLRALSSLYPSLQPFFVDACHVREALCFKEYYDMLRTIADISSPLKVLDKVLAVFAMWADKIKTGQVSSAEISEWKVLLQKVESRVLPTMQNKWVSLHSSEGLVCWCDEESMGQMFLRSKGVFYVCVSTTASIGHCVRAADIEKLGCFFHAMGIQPLTKVVEREPIAYGAHSSKYLTDLLSWSLPYVQRYLQKRHPDIYINVKKAEANSPLSKFKCVLCEQLFFRYKLPGELCAAAERLECSFLLEGQVLYATCLDNLSSLFLEFSKIFFDRTPDLQLANFLHLITLSIQAGSNEEEVEAILATQGISPFPEGEAKWSFAFSDHDLLREPAFPEREAVEALEMDHPVAKKARKSFGDTWPPRSWQQPLSTISNNRALQMDRLAACQRSLDSVMKEIEAKRSKHSTGKRDKRMNSVTGSASHGDTQQDDGGNACSHRAAASDLEDTLVPSLPRDVGLHRGSFLDRDQLTLGQPNEQQQELTGRLGEAVVFNHLLETHGSERVKWINADGESGLPYDIVVTGSDGQKKLVEVKATWSEDKDWFQLSPHEWDLACKLGERFVIIRVFLGGASARFLWLPDPSKLCQQRLIKLALILPRQQHGSGLLEQV